MKIIAIETSCDETAISIIDTKEKTKNPSFSVLSNINLEILVDGVNYLSLLQMVIGVFAFSFIFTS